jgi:hypothetical protein
MMTDNRCLTYEEFLQTPESFVIDLGKIIALKEKWGLDFTADEKILRSYMRRLQLRSAINQLSASATKANGD